MDYYEVQEAVREDRERTAFEARVAREDEADRLAQVAAAYAAKDRADRVGQVVELLLGLVDDGVLKEWSIKFVEPGGAEYRRAARARRSWADGR